MSHCTYQREGWKCSIYVGPDDGHFLPNEDPNYVKVYLGSIRMNQRQIYGVNFLPHPVGKFQETKFDNRDTFLLWAYEVIFERTWTTI